jgi:dinuclear metal center YbgI/SA1388 family protein
MTTVNDIYDYLNGFAPIEMKMDFDNVGHLVGSKDTKVTKILVALDITDDVITESDELETEVIVSHHPLFFSIKSVTDSDLIGKKIMRLVRSGQSAICMHTNLDAARGGVNDALARAAGIADRREAGLLTMRDRLPSGEVYSFGRVGCLECPCSMQEYLERLKKSLKTNGLRYHDAGRDVYKVAVVGGSGGDDFQNAVRQGCDTFITADIKYNLFLDAKELGINLIDGDHFCTENLVTGVLFEKLSEAFPEIETIVSTVHSQTVKFY